MIHNMNKRTITYIMNRVDISEQSLLKTMQSCNDSQITYIKNTIKTRSTTDKISAYDYRLCMKTMMLTSAYSDTTMGAYGFKWCYDMLMLDNNRNRNNYSKQTMSIMRKIAVNLVKTKNVPLLSYDESSSLNDIMNIRDAAQFIESSGLNAYDYIILSNKHWKDFVNLRLEIRKFPYAEYKIREKELIDIINHAIESDKQDSINNGMTTWITDFINYVNDNHPIITTEIDMNWFDYNAQFPFEFYIENMQINENVSNAVYNEMVNEKIKLMEAFSIPEHDVKACEFIMSNNRMITSKTRNVDSRNIQQWYNAINRITFKHELLALLNSSNNKIINDGIDGYNIISDITRSALIGMANNPYKTMIQSPNASIEYINAIYHDDDSLYRWCIWLRAQRALRENRALVLFTETADLRDLYYSRPVFKHCPPEIIKWLMHGIIPTQLTYDKIATMEMPKDVIRRMQAYPKTFNEWVQNNNHKQ